MHLHVESLSRGMGGLDAELDVIVAEGVLWEVTLRQCVRAESEYPQS